jgi:hypothetical protein
MNQAVMFFLVMCAMIVVDWCWAKYMKAAADKNAVWAAFWSASLIVISAFSVTQYIENHTMVLAAAIGAWIGTFYAVKHGEEKK